MFGKYKKIQFEFIVLIVLTCNYYYEYIYIYYPNIKKLNIYHLLFIKKKCFIHI